MTRKRDDLAVAAVIAVFIVLAATLAGAVGYFIVVEVGIWAIPALAIFGIVWAAVYAFVRNEWNP